MCVKRTGPEKTRTRAIGYDEIQIQNFSRRATQSRALWATRARARPVSLYFQERLRKAKEQEEVIHARHCYPTLGTLDRNRTWKPTRFSPAALRFSSPRVLRARFCRPLRNARLGLAARLTHRNCSELARPYNFVPPRGFLYSRVPRARYECPALRCPTYSPSWDPTRAFLLSWDLPVIASETTSRGRLALLFLRSWNFASRSKFRASTPRREKRARVLERETISKAAVIRGIIAAGTRVSLPIDAG